MLLVGLCGVVTDGTFCAVLDVLYCAWVAGLEGRRSEVQVV